MMMTTMNRGKVVSVSSSRFVSINARGGFLRHHQFIPRIFDLGEYRRSFPNLKKKGASFLGWRRSENETDRVQSLFRDQCSIYLIQNIK
jgi:hypothetical protein